MCKSLEEAREIINEADKKIAELFVERMKAVKVIYENKKKLGLPIFDPKREAALIERNSAFVENEELKSYYIDYQKHMMSISRAYQYKMQNGLSVAYSGVEGAFAHIAAGRIFPQGARVSYGDFESAYNSVVRGECEAAVLPIENSYAGEVGKTVDLIFSGELHINGIYELEIKQNLLGTKDSSLEDIKMVISHPQAISQSRDFIEAHGLTVEEAENTALAAKKVAELGDKTVGAIASLETAELYGLKVLSACINKSGENTTRFAVLSRVKAASPSLTSTVLMFTVKHEAGSLANAIGIIGKYGYNMTSLHSRPARKQSWQYYFYVELDGTVDNENGAEMIKELNSVCERLKVAGTFAPHTELEEEK